MQSFYQVYKGIIRLIMQNFVHKILKRGRQEFFEIHVCRKFAFASHLTANATFRSSQICNILMFLKKKIDFSFNAIYF